MNNIAYFIASYGKPEKIPTLIALQKLDPKYPIYIVIGDDDPKLEEYKQTYTDNLLIFSKRKFYNQVDSIGYYRTTDKICTYSRPAINVFARELKIKYIVYLFDDIKSMRLRYVDKSGSVKALNNFHIDRMIDMYIDLLNSSDNIYMTGPPQSSFYIGINASGGHNWTNRYNNFFVYDIDKELTGYRASTLEDMDLIMRNNVLGKLSVCPFGLHVDCRDPKTSGDSYGNMSELEYYEHFVLIDNGKPINIKRPTIHYKDYLPKVLDEKWRSYSRLSKYKNGGLI